MVVFTLKLESSGVHCGMSAQVVFIDQMYSGKLLKVIIFKGVLPLKREIVDNKL